MKETGIIRRIDELGRIVIPKEIRKNLKINTGDNVEIFMDENGKIVLKKYSTLLGMEEELFNVTKVINEANNATAIICDTEKVIVCYGKSSENYIDKAINKDIINYLKKNPNTVANNLEIVNTYIEPRKTYMFPFLNNGAVNGAMFLVENERILTSVDLELASSFKKFIVKQLDS